ncbi:MAG: class I adenylate-forming enzyme family protein [Acidimicrobiales bacterium]
MTLLMLLEMIASAFGDRLAIGTAAQGLTYQDLYDRAGAGAEVLRRHGAQHLAYVGSSNEAFPVALFASAWAGVPFIPLNYRLGEEPLRALLAAHDDVLVVADDAALPLLAGAAATTLSIDEWNEHTSQPCEPAASVTDGEDIAVLLYTSGTTAAPKAVVLRHRHLSSYVIGSVEFGAADDADATLVSVPPYHIAGVANVLSNVYSARRLVYLPAFTAERWLDTVQGEGITHAMVVPTMLARVVDHLGAGVPAATPTLRSLAYGGARMPATVLAAALQAFPATDFVNAYGLTETSSTIAVLGPDDHRAARAGGSEEARARLASVGRLVPGIEVDIRDGEIWVRGEQVSGEYLGQGGSLDADGWFPTRDRGRVDDEGYLFIEGRSDDTIIRGGENIAPAEIEDVLLTHPAVKEAAVVGLPDDEWGQRLAAVVVLRGGLDADAEELRELVRARLRTSKTPDLVVFRDELPHTETGKLLRRTVLADLTKEL